MNYWKFAATVLATALSAVYVGLSDNVLTWSEGVNVLVMALGAISVLGAGELPAGVWKYMKTYVAALSAGAVFLVSALSDNLISTTEWVQFSLAVLAGVGVLALPGPKVQRTAGA